MAGIRVVAAGDALLAPSVTRRLIDHFASRPLPRPQDLALLETLTEREREVFELIAQGFSSASAQSATVSAQSSQASPTGFRGNQAGPPGLRLPTRSFLRRHCAPGGSRREVSPGRLAGAYAGVVTIRVILAEDNLLVREGVRRLLETRRDADLEVVASCGDLDTLLAAVESEQPDVVLTDIRMPPTHTDEGLRAAARLRRSHPQVGVVLLSQFDAPSYARALLEEGSAGRAYLLKERVSDPEQLVAAIREVARGGSVIDSKVVETLVAALGDLAPAQEAAAVGSPGDVAPRGSGVPETLTERELEVLRLIVDGASNQEIARALVVSLATVKTHVNHIFGKLGAESRVQVVARARTLGLLGPA